MTGPAPDFSVIVLFGRGRLEPCLSSLLNQEETNFEIIGVIDFDEPPSPDPRVKFLKIPELNPALRRNRAAAISRGKYLAFIDDDATAAPDWLAKAKTFLESNQDIAGCGGSNIAPGQMNWKQKITDLILTDQYFGAGSGSYQIAGQAHPARPGELHLSNFFLRRESFDAVKGFNEKIGYGGEDSEMVYQIGKKTGKVLEFIPDLFVYHARREFGIELLKRNYRFRSQNGRMIWVYPEMYKWNRSLLAALLIFLINLPLAFIFPAKLLYFYLVVYYIFFFFSSLFRLKTDKWLSPLMPFAYFLHHFSYAWGICAGLVEGGAKGNKKMAALLHRDDLE